MAKHKMKDTYNDLDEELPGNSKASQTAPIRETLKPDKEEELTETPKKILKRGHAIRRKKSLTRSISETFINEDSKNVGRYILFEVLIPAAKNLIQEMVTQGIEMFLFGEGGGRSRTRDRDRTIVSYNSMYKRDRDEPRREYRTPRRDKFGLSEIYFRKGDEASEVLEGLCDLLEKYEEVTVAAYFDLAGIDSNDWTLNNWGWDNLKRAYCTHTRNGWAIVLPEPVELD